MFRDVSYKCTYNFRQSDGTTTLFCVIGKFRNARGDASMPKLAPPLYVT